MVSKQNTFGKLTKKIEGTPDQITRIVDIINEKGIKGLFLETSIDPRSMEAVSIETNIPIMGSVFTDSIGEPEKMVILILP